MQICAVRANDRRGVIVLEWPNGDQLMFELSDAVHTAISMLRTAAKLFPTAAEYEQFIAAAQANVFKLRHQTGMTQ
jgi:hypothetical protein